MDSVICFGDSITNGARDEYHRNVALELSDILTESQGNRIYCHNEGINGETTSEMADRAYATFSGYPEANYLTIQGGTNDTKVPIPPQMFERNLRYILDVAEYFDLVPTLALIPPIDGPGLPCYDENHGNSVISQYNDRIRGISKKRDIIVTDLSDLSSKLYQDSVHLNHEGYEEIAKRWAETIEELR